MLNSKIKTLLGITLIFIYLLLVSYSWNLINIPLSNKEGVVGYLTQNNINPLNDTLRFLLFLIPPLIFLFFYITINYFKKTEKLKNFLKKKYIYKNDYEINDILPIFLLLIVFLIVEFLSIDLSNHIYLDTLHDGDYLTPLINYINFKGLWTTSFTIHGGRDFFIPIIASNIFDSTNIAPIKFFNLILIFFIKILSIVLSFQISRFTNLEKKYKMLIFTFLSLFILSISNYNQSAYFDVRDIFVLIFFIFLLEIFFKKDNLILLFLLALTTSISLFFHYDTGIYLNLTFLLFSLYLFLLKDKKRMYTSIFFLSLNYILIFLLLGSEETLSFFKQMTHIIQYIDKIHGLEYPQPFFSIGHEDDGSRGTRTLVFLLIGGIIINLLVFIKNNFLSINEKVLLLFLYFYTFISFKNALGRSDSQHMMVSSDWIVILLFSFLLFFTCFFISKQKRILFPKKNYKKFLSVFVLLFVVLEFDQKKIINYGNNYDNFIKKTNSEFLTNDKKAILKKVENIIKTENCIENFTADLSIPYLLNKPNCTKFFSSWIASGKEVEEEYISHLKQKKIKFIIYESPYFHVDNIKTSRRLVLVDNYIKKNYLEVFNDNEFIIMKKRNIS